jgi:hypothetical protein
MGFDRYKDNQRVHCVRLEKTSFLAGMSLASFGEKFF